MEKFNRQEMYIMQNSKFFPPEQLNSVMDSISKIDDSKIVSLSAIEYKDPNTMLIISIFLGTLGIDRFMLGDTSMGILKLLTGGLFGVMTIIDWFSIQKMTKAYNYKLLRNTIQVLHNKSDSEVSSSGESIDSSFIPQSNYVVTKSTSANGILGNTAILASISILYLVGSLMFAYSPYSFTFDTLDSALFFLVGSVFVAVGLVGTIFFIDNFFYKNIKVEKIPRMILTFIVFILLNFGLRVLLFESNFFDSILYFMNPLSIFWVFEDFSSLYNYIELLPLIIESLVQLIIFFGSFLVPVLLYIIATLTMKKSTV
jgi:TM2 domain-containing membrane protein YozV